MAIVHRKVFQAKAGQSAPLVEHFLEAVQQMKANGINWETRGCRIFRSMDGEAKRYDSPCRR